MLKSILISVTLLLLSFSVNANTYYVTTVSDTGVGSLRSMIDTANSYAGLDTILLSLGVHDTIHIGSHLPTITDSLVITGLPCQNPTVDGDSLGFTHAAFYVSDASIPLTVNYLNIFNCKFANGTGAAGAISAGYLYLNYCYLYGNFLRQATTPGTGSAGAVTAANLWAYNCSFNSNSWFGAATVLTNGAGAISSQSGHLYNCTFVSNYSQSFGGALNGGFSDIQNCTFANNTAKVNGGAIFSSYTNYPHVAIGNNIVWGNSVTNPIGNNYLPGISVAETILSGGCNILQDTASIDSFKISGTDITSTDPQFGTFGYYNGCVPVLPVLCGSIAQNHASCPGATTTDAQGITAQGIRDAGAFELTHPVLGNDTIDSIQRGTTASLYNYFNTTGYAITWPAGLNDSSAAAVDSGSYTVMATSSFGCSDTATATILYATDTLNTGIQEMILVGFKICPNPTKDIAIISWSSSVVGELILKVNDVLGRVVLQQNMEAGAEKIRLNTGSLVPGVYFVTIQQSAGNLSSARLVVAGR